MCNREGTESCWDVNRMKAGRELSKFMVNKNYLLLRSQILKKTKILCGRHGVLCAKC